MRFLSLVVPALSVASALGLASIKAGDKMPPVDLDYGFPPQKVFLPSYTANKNMIVLGLPGTLRLRCVTLLHCI
jgi:hypothetical protein